MSEVRLYLFGNPRLERDGVATSIRRRKSVALLAYLALSRQSHNREALAALIWPEYDQSSARGNLRRELSRLRQDVGEKFLTIDRQQVAIVEDELWVDVYRFQECMSLVEGHGHFPDVGCDLCLRAVQEAVGLHSDAFMAGFTLPDAPAFDEWQYYTSEGLLRALGNSLQMMVDYHRMREEYDEAADYARRWLMQDPLHEAAQRQLMALYAYSGRRAAALRQYEEYVRLLDEELGVPPEEETTSLFRAIQDRQFPPARRDDSTGEMLSLAMDPARRFVIREAMASGGQGALFQGVDRISGETVVIKQLRPEQMNNPDHVTRFVREGEMLRRLNHPNIVRVLATYDHDGKHCLVMEYVMGGSLRDLLQEQGVLPVKRALEIGVELADALSRAHHLGVIHRDVKPANVLMAEDGTPRLTDFGLARLRQQRLDLTPTGALLGSPYYMSPEALRGEELDERSDIWSFGALLFEMLSGQPPFPGKQMAQIMMSILNDPVPSLTELCPDISPGLAALLRRMLTKDRDARIYSMRLIAAGLEALRDERMEEWSLGFESSSGSAAARTGGESAAQAVGSIRYLSTAGQTDFAVDGGTSISMTGNDERSENGGREDGLFVGREAETALLMEQLRGALAGRPQAAFIIGEAGAGKTSLMQAFARQAQREVAGLLVVGGEGNAFSGSGDPFLPFREILEMLTGDVRAPSAYGQRSPYDPGRLQAAAPVAVGALADEGSDLLRTMLSPERLLERVQGNGEGDVSQRLATLVAQWSAQQTIAPVAPNALFEQYARVLQRVAQARPLLLLLDDLQWVDEGSANLLLHLGKRLGAARVLIVSAYRPGDMARRGEEGRQTLQWAMGELQRDLRAATIDLAQTEGRSFVDALLDVYPNALGEDFRQTLFGLTRGNPLFTMELLRGMQERGDLVQDARGVWTAGEALDWETLPGRVEGAIGERLGRLDEQLLEILQVASVEGEEFTAEVIAQVLGMQPRAVVQHLSRQLDRQHRMVRSLGIVHNGERRLSRYGFRQNLVQRYLYQGLDEVERVYQHEEVGRALSALYGEQVGEVAVELALHFEQAALTPETVGYLKMAAERALRRGAFNETMRNIERALTLLSALPEGKMRAALELEVQLLRATALVTTRSVADKEGEAAYVRAVQLAEEIDDAETLSTALYGLAMVREFQGRYEESQALLERRLELPESEGDAGLHMESRELLACSTFHQGMFSEALNHAREGLAHYDPRAHGGLIPIPEYSRAPACHTWEAHALWFMGYPQQSLEALEGALRLAREMNQDNSLSLALVQAAFMYQFRGEYDKARDLAEEGLEMAKALQYAYREAEARILRGWGLAMAAGSDNAKMNEGLQEIKKGIAEVVRMGGCLDLPYFRALQAEVLRAMGRPEEALQVVELALVGDDGENRGRFFWDAELLRLRAALVYALGGKGSAPVAEMFLQQALRAAAKQDARMLGLRAAVDLAMLWREQGREEEARALAADHYGWFTEGMETGDLRRAATLL